MSCKTQRGMTMIELLVAMAIGVIVTLAVSQLLYTTENFKRTTTSTNDADQTGAYAVHALDRALRSAGSGIAQSAYSSSQAGVLGCRLNAGSFLPRTTAYPAPFSTYFLGGATPTALRVAPVLIGGGQSDAQGAGVYGTNVKSDVLVVMSASGAAGGVTRANYGAGSSTSIVLESTVGFNQYDVLLISQSGTTDCLLEEVANVPASGSTLTLQNNATTYPYYTTGTTTTLTTLDGSTASFITPLGNAAPPTAASPASPNNIQFTLFGVGTNATLYSYDLLQNQYYVQGQGQNNMPQAIADQVVQMNAIYGVALPATPSVFANWADPILTSGYDINTVMTTPATQQLIVAVRVAIVVRGEYYDANSNNCANTLNNPNCNNTSLFALSASSLTIFSGLVDVKGTSLAKTIFLNPQYRYRVFEFTVPLRDMILLAGGP
jgi:type IV pilus assembly protein PilW